MAQKGHYRLALIGLGAVGQGFVDLLYHSAAKLAEDYGFRASIVGVATRRRGSLFDAAGLDLAGLLVAARDGNLAAYPQTPGLKRDLDPLALIGRSEVDAVIEVSPTDLQTGQPAIDHVKAAFTAGKHVVTANKGPIALAFHDLVTSAKARGVFFGYEGTVMGGTPIIRLAQAALAGSDITGLRGIVNGTTNYILTQMESGRSYQDALAEAQRLGYAETDPSGDVEGFDAAGKLIILATVVMGVSLRMEDIARQGITGLTERDVQSASAAGERWKLIAEARQTANGLIASVKPERLPLSDPLAGVSGVTNAITLTTGALGPVTLVGPGAGGRQTGFAILSDLLELHRRNG